MSASLPDPPEHSRILQSSPPAMPTQPWIKIIIGVTLGVICTFLLSTYLLAPSKPLEPDSRVAKWAESKHAEAAKSAPAIGGTANPQESSARTDASPPDDSASRDAATNTGDPCDKQTWPYVSHECAAAQRTRNVRVIPTDKGAPTTIVTAAPTVTPPPPATDGQAPRQEPAPAAARVTVPSSAPEPAPLPAPAPTPRTAPSAAAAPAPVTSAAAPAEPPAPPRPDPQAKPQNPPAADNQATVNRAAVAPPLTQEAQPSRKSRERREARQRRARRDVEARREIPETTGSSDVRYEEMPRSGDEPLRASRSRATDDDSRTARSRSIEIDSDHVAPRSSRKRDERRRIVVEEPEERNVVREERPRQRAPIPFLFLNGADND